MPKLVVFSKRKSSNKLMKELFKSVG